MPFKACQKSFVRVQMFYDELKIVLDLQKDKEWKTKLWKNMPFGLLSYGKSKGLLGIPILVPLAR